MPAGENHNKSILIANKFALKLGGAEADALFESVSGLTTQISAARFDFVDSKGASTDAHASAPPSWGSISIQRGFDKGKALYNWHADCAIKNDKSVRKDGTIELFDAAGAVKATFSLVGAWPSAYQTAGANASDDAGHFFESVSLEVSSWERK